MVVDEPESYDSGKEFDYKEKNEGKCTPLVALTLNSTFPCIHVLFTSLPTT
jgi:hypothetical protein